MAGAGRGWNTEHGFDMGPSPPGFNPSQPAGVPQFQTFGTVPIGMPMPMAMPPPYWPPGPIYNFGPSPSPAQWPSSAPVNDGGYPGINLRNDSGGIGLPPGYNYIFPTKHCKFHIFKTADPPWQVPMLNGTDPNNHAKCLVPVNVTIKELMQQLGCNNSDADKNRLYEICEAGDGRWKKGLEMKGSDKDRMKKEIREFGWDETRTGKPGEKQVVWLWLTKD